MRVAVATSSRLMPAASRAARSFWPAVSGATGYEVYRATEELGDYTAVYTGTATSFTNTSLSMETTYYYKVRSVAGVTPSEYSSVRVATPSLTQTTVTPISRAYTSVTVYWTAVPGASGYEVWYSTQKFGTYSLKYTSNSGAAGNWTKTGLVPDKTYYYMIRPFRMVNGVKIDGPDSVKQSTAPGQVSMSVTRASSTSAKITWYSMSGAAGYEVWRGTVKYGTYSLKYTAKSTTTSWTSTGLTTGKAYYFQVRSWRMVSGKKVYSLFSSINSVVP